MPKSNADGLEGKITAVDWQEDLPITEAELELFEAHLLDVITAMIHHR